MTETNESLAKRVGISEGVAVAGATVAGYAYAFSYENGYLSHYALPFWLIDLSIVNVLITVAALILVLVVVTYVLVLFPAGPWSALLYQLANLVLPVGLVILILTATNWNEPRQATFGAVVGGLTALIAVGEIRRRIVGPLFLYRDRGSWLERWAFARQLERETHARSPDLLAHSIQTMHRAGVKSTWISGFWVLFVFGPLVTHYVGRATARLNTTHAIVAVSPECIAVRRYTEYMVCSDFDRKTLRVLPSFRLLHVHNVAASAIRLERLGRLSSPTPLGRD